MNTTASVGVLLAHEQQLFRDAVRTVLDREVDLQVVAEGADGLRALAEAVRVEPDVAVVDHRLSRCDGVTLTGLLADRVPHCLVVLLVDETNEDALVDAVESGARACVRPDVTIARLTEVIRAVVRGESIMPATVLGSVFARLIQRREERDEVSRLLAQLTDREHEVLALLAGGLGTAAIADTLAISRETTRTHVQRIIQKLHVHSRLGAVLLVTRHRLPQFTSIGAKATDPLS